MVVCSFFLQGRCRFGDRCWNEHPRDGPQYGQPRQQQAAATSSSWNSSGQRYQPPSTFSKNLTWTNRDADRSSYGSGSGDNRNRHSKSNAPSGFFTSQNKFNALANQDQARDSGQDKEGNLLADVIQDLDTWDSSGQWPLSVYCVLKEQGHLSGFADISPEELRLECYTSHSEGHFQNYVSSVQQLVNQWKQRVHEIKNWNPSSNSALLNQLTKPPSAAAPASFGGLQQSGFGTSNTSADKAVTAATFSFKPDSHPAPPNAGATSGFSSTPAFNSKPSFGFGTIGGTSSASSFSFAPTTTSGGAASTFSGFGSASTAPITAVSGFGSSGFGGTGMGGGFGSNVSAVSSFGGAPATSGFGGVSSSTGTSGFGAVTTGAGSLSTSSFGQGVTVNSSSGAVSSSTADAILSGMLFTPRNELLQEDLLQFELKIFTLGKVPLVPPPVDLLTIK